MALDLQNPIIRSAVNYLGLDKSRFQGKNREITILSDSYDKNLDLVLEHYYWHFATKLAVLTRLPEKPPFGYPYVHQLPADFKVKVFLNFTGDIMVDHVNYMMVAGGRVFSPSLNCYLSYTSKVENYNTMTATFVDAVALKIASECALPIIQDKESIDRYNSMFEKLKLDAAMVEKRMVSTQQVFEMNNLANQRQTGVYNAPGYTSSDSPASVDPLTSQGRVQVVIPQTPIEQ